MKTIIMPIEFIILVALGCFILVQNIYTSRKVYNESFEGDTYFIADVYNHQ